MVAQAPAAVIAAAAIFGAAVGSFLNVCIYRLPRRGLSLSRPVRSFCPSCGDELRARDNIPILSWILLSGRCRSCSAPISVRYLVVEAMTAALFAVVVHRHVIELGGSWTGCAVLLALVSALIVAAFVDIDLRLIPDQVTIGGMHLAPLAFLLVPEIHLREVDTSVVSLLEGLAAMLSSAAAPLPAFLRHGAALFLLTGAAASVAFVAGCHVYRLYRRRFLRGLSAGFRDVSLAGFLVALVVALAVVLALRPDLVHSPRTYALAACLLGMLAGSALVYLVGVIGTRVFRKPAMGFGDVKLMGLLGAFVGWKGTLIAFFVACLLGSVFGIFRLAVHRDRSLPFGPFLAAGALFVALWPEAFQAALNWFLGLIRVIRGG